MLVAAVASFLSLVFAVILFGLALKVLVNLDDAANLSFSYFPVNAQTIAWVLPYFGPYFVAFHWAMLCNARFLLCATGWLIAGFICWLYSWLYGYLNDWQAIWQLAGYLAI